MYGADRPEIPRNWFGEMLRELRGNNQLLRESTLLLREGNRLNEERFTRLDITLREQTLETRGVLHDVTVSRRQIVASQQPMVESQQQLVESHRRLVQEQRVLSSDVRELSADRRDLHADMRALSVDMRALIARIDALIGRGGNGAPPAP